MTSTTKKHASLAIIVVALGALFVDRFLLDGSGHPAGAEAVESVAGATRNVGTTALTGLKIPELPFPRKLPNAVHRAGGRDLFAFPGDSSTTDARGVGAGRGGARRGKELSDAAAFAGRHRLEAVLSDGGFEIAVVSGLWMRTGQSVDGCTLTRIERTRVRFTCGKDEAVLDLARDVPGS